MNAQAMKKAGDLSAKVYEAFMHDVVSTHVLNERAGRALSDKEHHEIEQEKRIDARSVYLMSISGKGGWSDDPEKFARYAQNHNITLLDHVLSVSRGSVLLCALDHLGSDPEMAEEDLHPLLVVVVVIGFLHDLDKMLQLKRDAPLTLEQVEAACQRYGIYAFLQSQGIELQADQIRHLIEMVEDSQSHRHSPIDLPPRAWVRVVKTYVNTADKLDGIWCARDAGAGADDVLSRLRKQVKNCHFLSPVLDEWAAIDIFDPHHPFLLDELLRRMSFACKKSVGIPPLLETHQDGRLFVLLPKVQAKSIVDEALKKMSRSLPFSMEIKVSKPGVPEIRNAQPDYSELYEYLSEKIPEKTLSDIFRVSESTVESLTKKIDQWLGCLGLGPHWSKKSGKLVSIYSQPENLESEARERLTDAAVLALLLNLKIPASKKNSLSDCRRRETELLDVVEEPLPDDLMSMDDVKKSRSRRVFLALWVLSLAEENEDLRESVWGEQGLLQRWLEGEENRLGFRFLFEGEGAEVEAAVQQHFDQLIRGQRVSSAHEGVIERCLFTELPARHLLGERLQIYSEVKVSAFSGREGRPDSVDAPPKGKVSICSVSLAEHKLRAKSYTQQWGGNPPKGSGAPTLVSSPVTSGLFAGLGLRNEKQLSALSIYDLSCQKVEKGKVSYKGIEAYQQRYRIARFERMPERTKDQITTLRLLLTACIRVGRPIHLFRGLPTEQKAFFYFDAMPAVLKNLLGGVSLRLEQIPTALQRLEQAETLIQTPGLGYDLLQSYANPRTRFSASCLVWSVLRDKLQTDNGKDSGRLRTLSNAIERQISNQREKREMTEKEGAVVRFGQSASKVQRRPLSGASANEEMLVFKLCLDAAVALKRVGQADKASLVCGIAAELETNLIRKDKMSAADKRGGQSLKQACIELAEQFVEDIWFGVLQGKAPAQKNKRLLGSVYRMAFIRQFFDANEYVNQHQEY